MGKGGGGVRVRKIIDVAKKSKGGYTLFVF
jgi:hypothetical protein